MLADPDQDPHCFNPHDTCADPDSSTLTMLFFVLFLLFLFDEGGKIQIPLLAGHQQPTSEMPFKWCFAGGQMMAQH